MLANSINMQQNRIRALVRLLGRRGPTIERLKRNVACVISGSTSGDATKASSVWKRLRSSANKLGRDIRQKGRGTQDMQRHRMGSAVQPEATSVRRLMNLPNDWPKLARDEGGQRSIAHEVREIARHR